MKNKAKKIYIFALLPVLILLNSCVGLSIDIQLGRNGSGRLTMEYRVSQMFAGIGSLDGNRNFPIIPVGRVDFERSIEQITGARIASYTERTSGHDTFTTVVIDFDNPQALLAVLDPSGKDSSLTMDSRQGRFNLVLYSPDESEYDQEMMELMHLLFTDYMFSFNFRSDANSTMTVTNGYGRTISPPPSADVSTSGRNVSFNMNIMNILTISDGFGLNIAW